MHLFTGPCMNIVSGCVQICKTLRDFAHDSNNAHYVHKAKSCQHSVVKSTSQLKHSLQTNLKMDFVVRSASPFRGDNRYQNATDESESMHSNHRESSPFDRKSPQPSESHRELSPFNRNSPQEIPRELSPFRSSPQPLENYGNNSLHHRGNDLSPRSTIASSDISFANSSVSR